MLLLMLWAPLAILIADQVISISILLVGYPATSCNQVMKWNQQKTTDVVWNVALDLPLQELAPDMLPDEQITAG